MKLGLSRWPLTTLTGILAILIYIGFTLTSWAFYPEPFGPSTHYLSRLGNFDYSPIGAYFYNLGCILTGIVLFPFFIGLYEWYTENKLGKGLLIIGQAFGICSAIALILIGVFSENQGAPHMLASSIFFELNFVVLILISLALLFHPKFLKVIAVYGLILDFLTLVFAFTFGGPLVEWLTVFGSLVFVGLVSQNTSKMVKEKKNI